MEDLKAYIENKISKLEKYREQDKRPSSISIFNARIDELYDILRKIKLVG